MFVNKTVVLAICSLLPSIALANGFGEERPYQFQDREYKQYMLNMLDMEFRAKEGGYDIYLYNDYGTTNAIGNQIILGEGATFEGNIDQDDRCSQQTAVTVTEGDANVDSSPEVGDQLCDFGENNEYTLQPH